MTHIRDLKPDPKNSRKHNPRNVGLVENSIQREGFGRSILIANDGTIIAGNATAEAAASAGMENMIVVESDGTKVIAVKRVDVEPGSDRFHNLAIADNRAAELADWDPAILQALAADIDLSQFFRDDELDALLASLTEPVVGLTDPDDVPPVPEVPTTKSGDLWLLGRHRLLCGDATVVTDVERLMDGERADICFTSPPYNLGENIGISNRSKHLKDQGSAYIGTRDNLTHGEYVSFLSILTEHALKFSDYLLLNVQSLAANKIALIEWLYAYRDRFADVAVWHKTNQQPAMAERVMNSAIEFIYFLSAEKNPSRAIKTASFRGTFENLYTSTINTNEFSDVHGAAFPVEFAETFISAFSSRSVLDICAGTGTTLIACEQTGRLCAMMEIDPHYCDVIVTRWEDFTGRTAVLAHDHAMVAD